MPTTVIAKAEVVIAYDASAKTHVYRTDCDVAFDEGGIRFVGPGYAGKADRRIEGGGLMVMPGMVNIHSHPSSEPGNKGWNDEVGSPRLYNTTLYEYLPLLRADEEGVVHCANVAWAELAMSGVTTVVDLSVATPGWLDRAAASGLRVVLGPMFRSARWFSRTGHTVEYDWDEVAARRAMDEALSVVDAAVKHPSGRLMGLISPSQVDTCSEALIRDATAAARERGMPIQIHAAQGVYEFQEMTRRHGMTPIQWLDSIGYLGPRAGIGHGIFLDHHPWLHWNSRTDLKRVAETGTTVAHCPTVFSRRGITLRDLGSYLAADVNIGLGTDTYPHNMLEEVRTAGILARVISGTPENVTTGQVFACATLGGARALGREDLGRIAVGAQADVVLVDLTHPMMRPTREPLRSLVYAAAERAVRDVFVAGRQIVRDGKVVTIDYPAAAQGAHESQKRAMAKVRQLDWAHRTVEEMSPSAYRWQ
jgi:cytosine/adenosine deaminase-related metal-dependent hydrolase